MAKDPIKKAENGTYYFRANLGYHPVTGKQIQKYRSGFSTKKEARAEYSKLILASTEELADKKEDITFKKFIEEIYLPWYKTQVKESTYKNRYSTIQKHFAYFYKKKVSEIEAINVQTWQLKLAKQFSPNYVRIVQGMLCLAFDPDRPNQASIPRQRKIALTPKTTPQGSFPALRDYILRAAKRKPPLSICMKILANLLTIIVSMRII